MSREVLLEITDLAYGGKGVGRTEEGKVCFVRDVIPGERVVVRIVREKRDFAEADLVEIQEASPDRVVPPCEYFGRCGGCSYQHLSYPAQLLAKKKQVETTLKRIGNFGDDVVEVQPVLSAPEPYYYRNRITVHTREGITGFFERDGRKVMNIRHCMLASEPVNQALEQYRKRSPYDGVCTLPLGHLARFKQTNDPVAALLLEEVAKQAGSGGELLVDAYCGAGFFAKRLRAQFKRVIGLEWNAQAIAAAQADDVLPHEVYWEGDVAQLLPSALAEASKNSVLLVNPPAQGLSSEVIQVIAERPLQSLLYISCNVATLARDLKKLVPSLYRIHSITPLDMFPQTAEIEVIASLEKL